MSRFYKEANANFILCASGAVENKEREMQILVSTMSPILDSYSLSLSPDEVAFYEREGYLVIPNVLDDVSVARMSDEAYDVLEAAGRSRADLERTSGVGGKLWQSGQYLPASALDKYINSPGLRSLAEQLMGGPSTLYMPFTAVKAGGGGGTFHFHQDNQYTRFDGPGINLWLALSPMTPENGCLNVVPRSHLNGTLGSLSPDGDGHKGVELEPTEFLPVRLRAGDLIAFSRLTVHGSGPNTSRGARLAYAVQFHRNDVNATTPDNPTPFSLLEHPRYNTAPVEQLKKPANASQDGH